MEGNSPGKFQRFLLADGLCQLQYARRTSPFCPSPLSRYNRNEAETNTWPVELVFIYKQQPHFLLIVQELVN